MAQESEQTQGGSRELRLALAMRGGVSLAVWIGGTCCEIDKLRTAEAGTGFWGRLLEASGYDAVAVDVLAGASAGGLNGVIYAAAQQYGFPMAGLREKWVELGDTARLLRKKEDAAKDGWPSLFKGDGFFFLQAEEALKSLSKQATPPRVRPPVSLTLSATLVEPIRRPGRSPSDEPLTERRFASGFRFQHPAHAWQGSDFPSRAGAPVWSRLALAARSTSSFPAAFEAALVRSRRAERFGAADPDIGEGLEVDMGGVFQERGAPDGVHGEFLVSDGGILDNIPLGRALTAIADAPAGRPTDRYLIYVQPGAPALPKADTEQAGLPERRAALSVLRGLLAARLPNEDIIGDLQHLDDYNTRIERAASLRRSGFQRLDRQRLLEEAAGLAWDGYRVLRADEDQRLVSKLLEDPIDALGEDPFPAKVGEQVVADDRWRSPLDAPTPAIDRRGFATELVREFLGQPPGDDPGEQAPGQHQGAGQGEDEPTGPKRLPDEFPLHQRDDGRVVAAGARPLLRIIALLIEWAQYLETTVSQAEKASLGKAKLYRASAFVRDAIDRPRRLGWVTLAATRGLSADPAGGAAGGETASDLTSERQLARGGRMLTGLARVSAAEAALVCEALTAERETAEHSTVLSDAVAGRLRALDDQFGKAWQEPTPAASGDRVDLRVRILCDVLVPIACQLQQLRTPAHIVRAVGHDAAPAAFLDRVLDGTIGPATLEALEVVAYPEFAAGLPGRRPVAFRRLSAANPTPLAPQFARLIGAAQHSGTWWDPDNTDLKQQEGIHVDLKLAGNELSNFSAFLVDEWRCNDWRWGRLDAVPTLVDLLLAGKRLSRGPGAWDRARLEELIAGPPEERSPLQRHILDTVLKARAEAVLQELADKKSGTTALRTALIATRQWEILAEELAIENPEALVAKLRDYDVGAQTVGSSAVRDCTVERLKAIAGVVDDVAIYGARLRLDRKSRDARAKPGFWARQARQAAAFAVPRAWGFAAARLVVKYVDREPALTDVLEREQQGRG